MNPEIEKPKKPELAGLKLPLLEKHLHNKGIDSQTVMLWPGIAALRRAAEHLGGVVWKPLGKNHNNQRRWLTHYEASVSWLDRFDPKELVSTWGKTAETINEFLQQRGFPSVQLQSWPRSDRAFGIAAVQETSLEWLQAGTAAVVRNDRRNFKGVHLDKGAQVRFWHAEGFPNVVAEIPILGDSGDSVLLTEYPSVRGFELLDAAIQMGSILSTATPATYDELIFPMISLVRRPNMGWLCGIQIDDSAGGPWELVQAIQEDRLTLDTRGAKAQSAFAGGMRYLTSFKPPVSILKIDKPMLCALRRRGLPLPLAAAWLNTDSWVR